MGIIQWGYNQHNMECIMNWNIANNMTVFLAVSENGVFIPYGSKENMKLQTWQGVKTKHEKPPRKTGWWLSHPSERY